MASDAAKLPRELIATIVSFFVPVERLYILRLVNTAFRDAVAHPLVWECLDCTPLYGQDLYRILRFCTKAGVCPSKLVLNDAGRVDAFYASLSRLQPLSNVQTLVVERFQPNHHAGLQQYFSSLSQLTTLYMTSCNLEGFKFPVMRCLQTVTMTKCELVRMQGLQDQPALTELRMDGCFLSNTADQGLPHTLTTFIMPTASRRFADGVPPFVLNTRNLQGLLHIDTVFLQDILDRGTTAPEWPCVTRIGGIVNDNSLQHISSLKSVRALVLNGYGVTSRGFAYLIRMSWLTELTLQGAAITDEDIMGVVSLQHLEKLELNDCSQLTQVCSAASCFGVLFGLVLLLFYWAFCGSSSSWYAPARSRAFLRFQRFGHIVA